MPWKGEEGRSAAVCVCVCVNDENPGGTVRSQGVQIKKVEDLKYKFKGMKRQV